MCNWIYFLKITYFTRSFIDSVGNKKEKTWSATRKYEKKSIKRICAVKELSKRNVIYWNRFLIFPDINNIYFPTGKHKKLLEIYHRCLKVNKIPLCLDIWYSTGSFFLSSKPHKINKLPTITLLNTWMKYVFYFKQDNIIWNDEIWEELRT